MNALQYPEIKPKKKFIKRIYIAVMLLVVGRAIQAAAKVDKEVKEEFAKLKDNFLLKMWIWPNGPSMYVGKTKDGKVKYLGWKDKGYKPTLTMTIKSVEAAMLLFTFQEATAIATTRNRLVVDGDLPDACALVRILNIVEVYLLPKIIAKLAVKRYPKWSQMNPFRKHFGRILIYVRAFTI